MGDIVATAIVISPEREKLVDFTIPYFTGAKKVVVTRRAIRNRCSTKACIVRGAVGVMQVIPQYAAAAPISIPNVQDAEGNIHAGVKMMHNIATNYDPGIDAMNKTRFTFAAYNVGPGRVAKLRRMAKEQGLDQNLWFGNVELMAAKDIGQETVQYVSNIYKYYVAYKMAVAQAEVREKAKEIAKQP